MNHGARHANLAGLLGAIARELGDVEAHDAPGVTEYRRLGAAFAAAKDDGSSVELRLHPEVAEAARRTPGTAASGRGPEWILFTPGALEGHDRDRAEAWFKSAWREAGAARRER
jgi:hypothetical protein